MQNAANIWGKSMKILGFGGRPPWARLGTGGMGQVKSGWGESFGISMIIIIWLIIPNYNMINSVYNNVVLSIIHYYILLYIIIIWTCGSLSQHLGDVNICEPETIDTNTGLNAFDMDAELLWWFLSCSRFKRTSLKEQNIEHGWTWSTEGWKKHLVWLFSCL